MKNNLKQKCTRTQITDLPEVAVEMSERELRIVSGGLAVSAMACSPMAMTVGGKIFVGTGGDGDHADFV
jgi:hypothetical protein